MPSPLEALAAAIAQLAGQQQPQEPAQGTGEADPLLDPIAGVDEKLRDTARWMLTTFAALGGVLVGGVGLSSLGTLTGDSPDERVVAALAGLVLALVGVALAIWLTSRVLSPFLNTFASANEHPEITSKVLDNGEVLRGHDYKALKSEIAAADAEVSRAGDALEALADDASEAEIAHAERAYGDARAEREAWEPHKRVAVKLVGSHLLAQRFRHATVGMIGGFGLAAIGVALFAWGSNPPKSETEAPVVLEQAPVRQRVQLTPAGVAALADARRCRSSRLTVLAIGGKEGSREVVTVPAGRCRSVRFVLTPGLGTPTAAG